MAKSTQKSSKHTKQSPVASTSKLLTDNSPKADLQILPEVNFEAEGMDSESGGLASAEEEELDEEHVAVEEELEEETAVPQTFASLGVIEPLCLACEQLGFKKPTDIQAQSIPFAIQDRDIIGLAQTGSGKTAAFALPILQALWENPQPLFACVLAPTR